MSYSEIINPLQQNELVSTQIIITIKIKIALFDLLKIDCMFSVVINT